MSGLSSRAVVAVALVALGLVGCGDSGDSATDPETPTSPATSATTTETEPTDSESPQTPTEPLCSDVVVAGEMLPEEYAGCYDDAASTWLKAQSRQCSSGQGLTVLGPKAYAVEGQPIVVTKKPLAKNKAFLALVEKCSA
ncbi:MAG: hypothetical protein V9G04_16340 [Nocardioides sp.]|jgi:hypothetical protein